MGKISSITKGSINLNNQLETQMNNESPKTFRVQKCYNQTGKFVSCVCKLRDGLSKDCVEYSLSRTVD